MSQAEELLNGMSEEVSVHTHPVPDTDTYFVIDPVTRKIENTNPKKHVIMQYDHNSERCTFELPRFIDGHDMLECTSVTVNVDNIEVVESEGDEVVEPRVNSDAPDMTDLRLHPNDPEKVISSWIISRNSTQLAGILSFHIEYKCVDSNGNVVYEWSTDNYDEYEIRARKKNGEAALVPHADLLEQWRTRIFGAGDSVMANIAAEGEAQVAAVKAESETQQEAVELKGAQTLDSIPEDYTEVDAMADEAVRSKADAIVCEAAGESIVLKDSSNDHIRGLRLFGKSTQITTTGKNLLPFTYKDLSKTENGVTLTVNGDGSISFSGTAKGYAGIPLYEGYASVFPNVITIFALGVFNNAVLHIVLVDKNGSTILETNLTSAMPYRTIDFSQYTDVERITVNAKRYDTGAVSGTIYPMIVSGEMNSATYEPYTGGKPAPNSEYPQDIVSVENPVVSIYGKNLARSNRDGELKSAGLVVTQYNNSSEIIVNGTTVSATSVTVLRDIYLPAGQYTLSVYGLNAPTDIYDRAYVMDGTTAALANYIQTDRPQSFRVDSPVAVSISIVFAEASVYDNRSVRFQLERGVSATEYEPHISYSINLANILPGIPVTSGGNYTDSDGRQWVCDEIDLERGVYVQRIKIDTVTISSQGVLDNGLKAGIYKARDKVPQLSVGAICDRAKYVGMSGSAKKPNCVYENVNTFGFTGTETDTLEALQAAYNGATIAYILATPIETPLTAEEITAFKALRTNYPNTTILNDAGAWMSVKYNADTKSYIDEPKVLKLVDSSTGVVYELKIANGSLTVVPV